MTTLVRPRRTIARAGRILWVEESRYKNDRVAWARDCVDWQRVRSGGLTPYQEEILGALDVHDRVCVRGPHGIGKTAIDALTVLHFSTTRDVEGIDWKNPTVASAWRQLSHYLWPEIRKWARLLRWDHVGRPAFTRGELLMLNLKLSTGEAFAVATQDASAIEGAHADSLFYLLDEAKAIPPETWDAIEGAFSGAGADTRVEAKALANSTPGEPGGRFYEIQSRKPGYEDWHPIHVTLDDAIAAGRISREWADQRARQWGLGSATYKNRVLGDFAESDKDAVIPLSWIERAIERWKDWSELGYVPSLRSVGVDVARSGDDKTVIAPHYGDAADTMHVISGFDVTEKAGTMDTANLVYALTAPPGSWATVDVIGIGAGVVDRLQEQGRSVVAFNGSERTDLMDRAGLLGFVNKRSASYWNLREMLDPDSPYDVALPPDDDMIGELTAPKWRVVAGGKIQVERKDDVAARLGRSPDKADAIVYAVWIERPVVVPAFRPDRGRDRSIMGGVLTERW